MKYVMFLLASTIPLTVMAADNMQFHGTLIAPPCSISEGKMIEVSFGEDLGVNKIDGNNYRQSVPYTVNCAEGYAVNNLAIVIDTTKPTGFTSSSVQTNKEGLGIRILVDGQAVSFAQLIAVSNPASPPLIEAVPVQDQGVTLTEGAFEATMTLRTDYM